MDTIVAAATKSGNQFTKVRQFDNNSRHISSRNQSSKERDRQ